MCVSEGSGQPSVPHVVVPGARAASVPPGGTGRRRTRDARPGAGRVAACGTGPLELQGEAEAGAPETELPADERHIDVLERVEVLDVAADPHVCREEAVHAAAHVVPNDIAVDADLIERHAQSNEANAADDVRLDATGPPREEQVGHGREHRVLCSKRRSEEIHRIAEIFFKPNAGAYRAHRYAVVRAPRTAVRQAGTVG